MALKWSWRGVSVNLGLLLVVLLLCGVGLELAWRALPISDSMGWNRTPPLSERAKRFEVSAPVKIVALGDSFAEWRTGEGSNMFDLLQQDFSDRGARILNLGQAGADVLDYTAAYRNYVGFKPDAIILKCQTDRESMNLGQPAKVLISIVNREVHITADGQT